jgi:hypothetical protein
MIDYRNKIKLENDIVIFTDYDGIETQLGNIKDLNIQNGYLIAQTQFVPINSEFDCELEVLNRWTELYPNGKTSPAINVDKTPSNEIADPEKLAMAEAIVDLNARLAALENKTV